MSRLCVHARPTDWPGWARCGLRLFGGRPAIGQCKACVKRVPPEAIALPVKATAEAVAGGEPDRPECVAVANLAPAAEPDQADDARLPAGGLLRRRNPFTTEELEVAERRAAVCEACEHNQGVTRAKHGFSIYSVKCGLCGCTGVSLTRGACRAEKWPSAPRANRAGTPDVGDGAGGNGAAGSEAAHHGTAGKGVAEKLLLRCHLSPGDVVTLTAAVRDLHRAHPGRFLTDVDTTARELWAHNPYLTPLDGADPEVRTLTMHYPLINQSNQRPLHFLHGYAQYLESQLGLHVPLTEFRGDVHLSEQEKGWANQVRERFGYEGRFWVMMAGGKYDFTTKWWPPGFYQQVVDALLGRVQFVQCGDAGHWHPPLKGTFNLVGQTSVRQFVRLVHHAQGVVCPVTFAMHLAAAVPPKEGRLRPCVVVAGGREPPHWEAYPGHQFLHTVGQLPCCATGGCWKSRCQAAGDGDAKDRENLCERPVQVEPELRVPQCMVMIKPQLVIDAIERSMVYYG